MNAAAIRFVSLVVTALAFVTACEKRPKYDFVIRNVSVVDVVSGASPTLDIGISGDVIATVSASKLSGAHEIDGSGLWAIPGLWDMHIHVADPSYFDLLVANGIVGVRDMGGDAKSATDGCSSRAIEDLSAWRQEIEAGTRVGPRMVLSGPVLSGGTPGAGSIAVNTPAEAKAAVAGVAARGADFIKVYENIPPAAFEAVAAEARARGLVVAGHVSENTLTILEAIEAGQRSIEHVRSHILLCFADNEEILAAFFDADDWNDDDRLWAAPHRAACPAIWARLRGGETWLTPTLAVERTRISGAEPGFENDPRRDRLPPSVREAVNDFSASLRNRSDAEKAMQENWWATQLSFVARAHREGAHMLAGSDAACEGVIPGAGLHEQLRLFVDAGLSPLEALRTATLEPAAYFGRADRQGRVATGFDADFVLLGADPRADIGAIDDISAVIVRGRVFDRGALNELLAGDDDAQRPPV